ncbi:hypothetical protein LINGRAPRIM_LOCUS919 [Linum grandiflorum]
MASSPLQLPRVPCLQGSNSGGQIGPSLRERQNAGRSSIKILSWNRRHPQTACWPKTGNSSSPEQQRFPQLQGWIDGRVCPNGQH